MSWPSLSPILGFAKTWPVMVWNTLFWCTNSWWLFQQTASLKQRYIHSASKFNQSTAYKTKYLSAWLCDTGKNFGTGTVLLGPWKLLCYERKTTIIEAMQGVVDALCDLKNEYIKFPSTNIDVLTTQQTFEGLTDLSNVVGAINGTHKNKNSHTKRTRLFQPPAATWCHGSSREHT